MQLTHITCLLLLVLGSQRALADDEISKETNEIIPREAIQKLDFSVRQALLRAIDKLEQEAEDDDADGDDDGDEVNDDDDVVNTTTLLPSRIKIQSTTALPVTTQTKDEILEESTNAADILPSVQFFTATYDENNAHEQTLAAFIDKTKVNKKPNKNNLGSPVLVSTNVDVESEDNHQAARSVGTSIQTNEISSTGLDEIKFEIRNVKTSPKPERPPLQRPPPRFVREQQGDEPRQPQPQRRQQLPGPPTMRTVKILKLWIKTTYAYKLPHWLVHSPSIWMNWDRPRKLCPSSIQPHPRFLRGATTNKETEAFSQPCILGRQ